MQFRFALLNVAALEAPLILKLDEGLFGDDCIFIANDWHGALVPVYLAAKYRPHGVYQQARSILAVHNLRHQVDMSCLILHGSSAIAALLPCPCCLGLRSCGCQCCLCCVVNLMQLTTSILADNNAHFRLLLQTAQKSCASSKVMRQLELSGPSSNDQCCCRVYTLLALSVCCSCPKSGIMPWSGNIPLIRYPFIPSCVMHTLGTHSMPSCFVS